MKSHPLDKGLTDEKKNEFWNILAETYTSEPQGDMPERITEWLYESGFLSSDKTLLEIGSGPGTYSFPFARVSKCVTCLDSSSVMMNRLSLIAESEGVENLETVCEDWDSFNSDGKWDVVAATLCSFIGSPESLDKMDSMAENCCIIVSWIRTHEDDLHDKIFAELGLEYSFSERKTDNISEILESTGRIFENKEFEARIRTKLPTAEVVNNNAGTYSVFGLEDEARAVLKGLVEKQSVDGFYIDEATNSLRVTVWNPIKR